MKLSAASASGYQSSGKKKIWEGQTTPPLSLSDPMVNSSVMHIAFYPHFNGPRDHSGACEALGEYSESSCFHFIVVVGRRGPWSVSLTPLSPCLSLSPHLPLSLCTPQRVLSDRIKSVGPCSPHSQPVCVCVSVESRLPLHRNVLTTTRL